MTIKYHAVAAGTTPRSMCLTARDHYEWEQYLPASRCVFGSPAFVDLSETLEGGESRLFVTRHESGAIAYPFYLRTLPEGRFPVPGRPLYDTGTPPFTGPVLTGESSLELLSGFRSDFHSYCRQSGIISEFAHLHPWQSMEKCLVESDIHEDRQLVYVDTTLSEDELWSEHFAHACRKNLKRGQSEGVEVIEGRDRRDVQEFHRIYTLTMERRQAAERYLFPLEYFEEIQRRLPENSRFALAVHRGVVIAATLYMYDDETVYSYLGGADEGFQHLRPTNQVIFETIQWSRRTGRSRLLLGGGYKPDDGIFRFKSTFSKFRIPFRVYRTVHDPSLYEWACMHHGAPGHGSTQFFPAYRDPARLECESDLNGGREHD
jgi:hypothetical protein